MHCVSMDVRSYRDLIAWQKAMDLVAEIYSSTQVFPKAEMYGLVSQLRRAAVSVPSDIAEGHARQSTGEFRQFLGHALGSVAELDTQILIGEKLGYLDADRSNNLLSRTREVGKIINGLIRALPIRR